VGDGGSGTGVSAIRNDVATKCTEKSLGGWCFKGGKGSPRIVRGKPVSETRVAKWNIIRGPRGDAVAPKSDPMRWSKRRKTPGGQKRKRR